MSLPTAVVAPLSLLVGFGVAQATGVRALGGVVLVLALAWCARQWAKVSALTAVALSLLYVGAFIASHLLARLIGAWPSVIAVAAVVALAAAWVESDGRRTPA